MKNDHPTCPLVTLITDFGLCDEYVGVLKGVLLSHNTDIRIVDISHSVPAQDIPTASYLLARSYVFFPPGTVHLVVVDPGVGSERPLLAIHSKAQYFVAPDNGVLTPIINGSESISIHRITESDLFLPRISNTFHGRDIMAPVVAQLATGLAIDRVGPQVSPEDCLLRGPGSCSVIDGVLYGEITHVDRFGNLCTNISRDEVNRFCGGKSITIQIDGSLKSSVTTLCSSYASQPKGELLALFDSNDFLEISENMGNASRRLQVSTGCRVLLFLK